MRPDSYRLYNVRVPVMDLRAFVSALMMAHIPCNESGRYIVYIDRGFLPADLQKLREHGVDLREVDPDARPAIPTTAFPVDVMAIGTTVEVLRRSWCEDADVGLSRPAKPLPSPPSAFKSE